MNVILKAFDVDYVDDDTYQVPSEITIEFRFITADPASE
jgi:hypothetical protein